jgi:2-oxoglutarate dehydrogenase E2 component (dihydrolipoamide succinyltransferase)
MLEQTGADGSKAVVLVSADRASDYGTVFQVIEALRLKSFNRVVMGATLPAAAADLSPAVQVPGPDGPALPSGPAADPAAPVPSGTATVPAAPAPAGPAADPAAPAPAGLEAATETPG